MRLVPACVIATMNTISQTATALCRASHLAGGSMQLEKTITVSWVTDLGSPTSPGKCFCHGVWVNVQADKLNAAQTKLGEGAMDLLFNATLVKPFTGDTYYVLGAFEVIK
jgi:hypothetical protein